MPCWAQALKTANLAFQILNAPTGIQHGPGMILKSIKPLLHFLLEGSLLIPAKDMTAINPFDMDFNVCVCLGS